MVIVQLKFGVSLRCTIDDLAVSELNYTAPEFLIAKSGGAV